MSVRGLDVLHEADLEGALDVLLADRMTIVLDPDETRDSLRAQLSSPDAVASEHRLVVDTWNRSAVARIEPPDSTWNRAIFNRPSSDKGALR